MKKNHGISIVELVIVMIIMILLVTFAVYSGIDSVGKAKVTELYSEMNSIKTAIGGIMTQKVLEDHNDEWLEGFYNQESGDGWYIIRATDELNAGELDLSDKYEIDIIKRTYLVNFEKGAVELLNPVEVMGYSVKTYESVRALVESDKI